MLKRSVRVWGLSLVFCFSSFAVDPTWVIGTEFADPGHTKLKATLANNYLSGPSKWHLDPIAIAVFNPQQRYDFFAMDGLAKTFLVGHSIMTGELVAFTGTGGLPVLLLGKVESAHPFSSTGLVVQVNRASYLVFNTVSGGMTPLLSSNVNQPREFYAFDRYAKDRVAWVEKSNVKGIETWHLKRAVLHGNPYRVDPPFDDVDVTASIKSIIKLMGGAPTGMIADNNSAWVESKGQRVLYGFRVSFSGRAIHPMVRITGLAHHHWYQTLAFSGPDLLYVRWASGTYNLSSDPIPFAPSPVFPDQFSPSHLMTVRYPFADGNFPVQVRYTRTGHGAWLHPRFQAAAPAAPVVADPLDEVTPVIVQGATPIGGRVREDLDTFFARELVGSVTAQWASYTLGDPKYAPIFWDLTRNSSVGREFEQTFQLEIHASKLVPIDPEHTFTYEALKDFIADNCGAAIAAFIRQKR